MVRRSDKHVLTASCCHIGENVSKRRECPIRRSSGESTAMYVHTVKSLPASTPENRSPPLNMLFSFDATETSSPGAQVLPSRNHPV